ncbi:MAG: hypothetical protein AAFW68_02875 [Pseudomonadota bacterium]
MKRFALSFVLAPALIAAPLAAFAQAVPSVTEISAQSIERSVRDDAAAALAALDTGDYAQATTHLRAASLGASRLSVQKVAERITLETPSFNTDASQFTLARSSTVQFENFLRNGDSYERIFKNQNGKVVTVRVFGEEDDLKDFMFIKDDPAMRTKGGIELAEMAGETALKKRGTDGSLSVIMMSEDDHALIEVVGDDEATVMAFIDDLENASQ